jgi:hypothetical protein
VVAPPGMRGDIPMACCYGVSVIDGRLTGRGLCAPSTDCL